MASANDVKVARVLYSVRNALVDRLPDYGIEVRERFRNSAMSKYGHAKYIEVLCNGNWVYAIDYGDWDEDYGGKEVQRLLLDARVKVSSDTVIDMSAPNWMDRLVATIGAQVRDGR